MGVIGVVGEAYGAEGSVKVEGRRGHRRRAEDLFASVFEEIKFIIVIVIVLALGPWPADPTTALVWRTAFL